MDSGPNGDSFLAPRMLPDPDEGGDYHWPSYCMSTRSPSEHTHQTHTSAVAHPIRIRTTPSLWCSAACPTGDKALFAIGTSDGLHTLEGFGSHWTLSQKPFPNEQRSSSEGFRWRGNSSHASVSAVEWLSSEVIASGLRNSAVFLHDLRSGGSATRLQHPHSVTKIRKVDQYRLVVGGHNSVCSLVSLSSWFAQHAYESRGQAPNVRHPLRPDWHPAQAETKCPPSYIHTSIPHFPRLLARCHPRFRREHRGQSPSERYVLQCSQSTHQNTSADGFLGYSVR